jgi:putative transposase
MLTHVASTTWHAPWNGHLWQGQFFSSALDETYLWAAIRYVGRNSVRAGMVRRGEQDPWSSAGGYCGLRHDATLTVKPAWRRQFDRVGDLASDG